jgi:tricorn protease-like protein
MEIRAAGRSYLDDARRRRRGFVTDDASRIESDLVFDGRCYFCSDRSGSWNMWRVAVDEATGGVLGKPEPVPTPARTRSVSLAADGQRFVYDASDTIANIYRAAFDPISETVVSEPAAVTSGTRPWVDVDVAADGRLPFVANVRGRGIYVSDGDGARLSALAPDAAPSQLPRWSPDGAWIAFASLKNGDGNFEIFITRADGSQLRRMTFFGRSVAGLIPLWSPGGRRLAVTTGPAGGTRTYLIDVGEPWTRALKAWLTPPGDHPASEYRPWSWSRDGRSIIAYSWRGAGMIVYSADTTTARRASATGVKPRWMSDSRRVIYVDAGKLFLLDVESGRSHELYGIAGELIADPAISPDDRTIYFVRQREESDIWMGTLAMK